MADDGSFRVEPADVDRPAGVALAGFLRRRMPDRSWADIKRLIATGKVHVAGARELAPDRRLGAGVTVEVRMAAPRPRDERREVRIVFEDSNVVVIDKPSGVSSVPFLRGDTGTAMDLVREAWRRMGRPATTTPLHIVHRIDKDTSGLLVFAKTKRAELGLASQLRRHEMERVYLCVAHGRVVARTIESELVADRGDGIRGTARGEQVGRGKRAVTHVAPKETLHNATLCEVRLETGKTHQIRIHFAEAGHPLVGETVYVRDLRSGGGVELPCERLLLHAATLGFVHPVTGVKVSCVAEPPPDFTRAVEQLRRGR